MTRKADQHVRVTEDTWKELNQRKGPGDSFDEVIRRLLDAAEAAKEDEEGNAQPTPTTAD